MFLAQLVHTKLCCYITNISDWDFNLRPSCPVHFKTVPSNTSWSLFNMNIPHQQLADIIRNARSKDFPLSQFLKDLVQWFEVMAYSVNTKPEFVLVAAMSVVSTLMGPKTKLSIRPTYREPCNLFTVCLSEPGAGKSQAFELAVERPLRNLKNSMAQSVVVNDFTRKGLFQRLVAKDGRALIAHSEMSSFYELILKKQLEGSGEHQLYSVVFMMELPNGRSQAPGMRLARIATRRNVGKFFPRMHWHLVVLHPEPFL